MNAIKRVAKNMGALSFAILASKLLSFFFVMYIARYLGSEGFGVLSFAIAFTGVLGIFSDIGLGALTTREVARENKLADKYVGNIFAIKLILAIFTFGLIAFAINLLNYPQQTIIIVYFVGLSTIIGSFSGIFYSIFRAFEKMGYHALGDILSSMLLFIGALFVINKGLDIVKLAYVYFFTSIIVLTYYYTVCAIKFVPLKLKIDFKFWKGAIKKAFPFGLINIFIVTFYWIDSVMLSLMQGDMSVGLYSVASTMVIALAFIPIVFHQAIFPLTSRFFKTSKELLKFVTERYFRYMLIISVPLAVGTTLLADKIILSIFGTAYSLSIVALQILIWGVIFNFTSISFENLFYSIDKQYIVTIGIGLAAILNIAMNFFLIPRYDFVGASIATTITWIFCFSFMYFQASKTEYNHLNKNTLKLTIKVLISCLIMGLFVLYSKINLVLTIFIAALIYFCLLYIIKGFDKKDMAIIQKLFSIGNSLKNE